MIIDNISLKRGLFVTLLITSIVSTIIISVFWIVFEIKNTKEDIEHIIEVSIDAQKMELKSEIEKAFLSINLIRESNSHLSIDEQKSKILQRLTKIRFGNGGYLFVNTTDGQALVFDGNLMTTYKSILNLTDPDGQNIFDLELEACQKPEGDFINYGFKRISTQAAEAKMSFIKLYKEWEWIVGAGDYLDDLSDHIELLEIDGNRKLKSDIIRIIIILLSFIIILGIINFLINKFLNRNFILFTKLLSSEQDQRNSIQQLQLKELREFAEEAEYIKAERNEAKLHLIESEKRFRGIFESGIIGVTFWKENGDIIAANDSFLKLIGYTKDDLINNKINWIKLTPEKYKSFDKNNLIYLKSNNKNEPFEKEYVHKTGYKIPILIGDAILSREPLQGVAFILDITKRKNAEWELLKYKDQLEEKVKKRTAQLESKNKELEQFNKLFVDREFRIKELKDQISQLENIIKNSKISGLK